MSSDKGSESIRIGSRTNQVAKSESVQIGLKVIDVLMTEINKHHFRFL